MWGCSTRATSWASAAKRRMNSGSLASRGWTILTATSRPTCGWNARCTAPKPPSPRSSRSRYPRRGSPPRSSATSPLAEGRPKALRSRRKVRRDQRTRRLDQRLEPEEVELSRPHAKHVAGGEVLDPLPADQLTKVLDIRLERVACRSRGLLSPERVDQTLSRHQVVRP